MSRRTTSLLVVMGLVVGLLGFVLSVAGSAGAASLPEVAPAPVVPMTAPSLASISSLTVALAVSRIVLILR